MIPIKIDFPVFEANQVLTNDHLNSMRLYLDEQIRLTRATLHGVGVVCGLTVSVADSGKAITLSKGYGITSEGYVAMLGNEDFVADRYQTYEVPKEDSYTLLQSADSSAPPLLELLDKGHDDYANGTALTDAVLKNTVVMLFVELLEENLKNCSPSSCDDKGKKVTVTLRKLLIDEDVLKAVNAKILANIETAKAKGDFFPNLTARLDLLDLRLPRLDLLADNKINAQAIFTAYQQILTKDFFAAVGSALDEAYRAFQPLLSPLPGEHYLSEKLALIFNRYETAQKSHDVIYAQYFYGFLDDIIQAYDEFRWNALDFMALCNPPEELFPRHLELGEAKGENFAGYKMRRHYFRPSPAIAEQKCLGGEVQQLFQRLKLLLEQFEVPKNSIETKPGPVVKITPSRLGGAVLSEKAIPYYYRFTRTSLLPNTWNFHKTRTGRIDQNLGYFIDSQFHRDPSKPASVLHFDLEHFNFFRIEGHIGLRWQEVLTDLLNKISVNRLPFDVVALNAHSQAVSSNTLVSSCITNDLQVIYDVWAKELECLLNDKISVISKLQFPVKTAAKTDKTITAAPAALVFPVRAKINVLTALSDSEGSLGKIVATEIKKNSATLTNAVKLSDSVVAALNENPEVNNLQLSEIRLAINKPVEVVSSLVDFTNALPDKVNDLDYASISSKYQTLTKAIADYVKDIEQYTPPPQNAVISADQKIQILKVLVDLLNNCLIERLEVLGAELERRKKQIEELIFFSHFIRKHPGLEHKAGVPKGGTFVLVFQETPTGVIPSAKGSFTTNKLSGATKISAASKTGSISIAKPSSLNLTADQQKLLIDTLKSQGIIVPDTALSALASSTATAAAIAEVFDIPEQVVIADFYLPYRCCSSCPPVQFIVPKAPPTFIVQIGCTNVEGTAIVTITAKGGLPPYDLKVDQQDYQALPGTLPLLVGSHTLKLSDAEGIESVPQTITIASAITLSEPSLQCSENFNFYTATFSIFGGTPPYLVNGTEIKENSYTSEAIASGTETTFTVVDSRQCTAELVVNKTCEKPCDLPCDGIAVRRGYSFSLPNLQETGFALNFSFEFPQDNTIDLSDAVHKLLQKAAGDNNRFAKEINALIADKTGSSEWLAVAFRPSKPELLDTWVIEYYRCLPFTFKVTWPIGIITHLPTITTITVTPTSSTLVMSQGDNIISSVDIPAFNVARIDKCNPLKPVEELCAKPVDLSLEISKNVDGTVALLEAKPAGSEEPIAYLWEVQDGNPFVAKGQQARFTFTKLEPKTKLIRLTAFTKDGCTVIVDDKIELDIPQ